MSDFTTCVAFMTCMVGECDDCPYRNYETPNMFGCQEKLYSEITRLMSKKKCDWTSKKDDE